MDSFLLSRVTMKNLSLIWMAMLLMPAACIEIPDLAVPPETPPGNDAGTGPQQEPIGIQWVSPMEGAPVGSTARLQVQLTGAAPDRVELLVDGAPVTTLDAPYSLTWETWRVSEGAHVLVVRALRNEHVFLSAERTVVVDRTRPRMIAQVPVISASNVAVRTPIQATFSEPLDGASVNGQSIQLVAEDGRLDASILLSGDGRTLTLNPASPLPVNQRIQVVMADTVVDFAGNRLESTGPAWGWSVPAYLQWGAPQIFGKIEESTAVETSLRVGSDARPVVAWTQNGTVRAKRWAGEDWEYLGAPLSGATGSDVWGNALQLDPVGRPMLAWLEYATGSQSQIHVRRWNGTAWEPMGTFMTTSLTQGYIPWMGFSSGVRGLPVVAWRERNSTQEQVVFRQWNGSSWVSMAAPVPMKSAATVNYMGFDLDVSGRPVLTFSETESGKAAVGRVMQWNGTAWTEFSAGLGLLPMTRVVDDAGRVFVGGSGWGNGVRAGLIKQWDGSTWVTVGEPLADIAGGTDRGVDAMALDSHGSLVVLASEAPSATETASRIGQTRRWTGTQWESLGGILKPNPGSLLWGIPDFALAADDEPIVSWTEKVQSADTFIWAIDVHHLNH
ncbi:Ig-like domain-containing protein [Corallococcus carmarthensis]|uniref:Ig-like domain-containing protein n=1 Tax=Corallococcus carmarthensis TaxID=2316728 RepID=UPI00148C5978|nr:Ig-like domain-containing protein [Corallococcus carmarthensis]NOK17539.1 Ig-like domain-containing protein [Corallococcus carmarthensis]